MAQQKSIRKIKTIESMHVSDLFNLTYVENHCA